MSVGWSLLAVDLVPGRLKAPAVAWRSACSLATAIVEFPSPFHLPSNRESGTEQTEDKEVSPAALFPFLVFRDATHLNPMVWLSATPFRARFLFIYEFSVD